MNQIVPSGHKSKNEVADLETQDYVTMYIEGQMFGIPVLTVRDVLGPQNITRIPLSPPEVAGSLNLRGRIVTTIDVRLRLRLPPQDDDTEDRGMSVAVEHGGELYSLRVNQVGEVLSLPAANFERNPPTLDPSWRDFSAGIFRLDNKLMVVLDVGRLLDFSRTESG